MNKSYYEIKIVIDEIAFESITAFFMNFKNSGCQIDEESITFYFEEDDWKEKIQSKLESNLAEIKNIFSINDHKIDVNKFFEQNWNKDWEDSIQPIVIDDKIVIKPTWREFSLSENQILIQIDPKMAFGTGHHESTRLCIRALLKFLKKDSLVLDMGCGTSILAIASILLGAKSAVAIDNDPLAIENSRENISLNNVTTSIELFLGDSSNIPNQEFDLIISNIDFRTNSEIISTYPNFLKSDGLIILSGLLVDDLENMKKKLLEYSLKAVFEDQENEWGLLVVER